MYKRLQLLKVKRHGKESILSGKYNKNNPLSISIQSRTESKSIYKAKYVTSDVRARIVCGSHSYKHEEQSEGGRNDSKSTIPAWDATCL